MSLSSEVVELVGLLGHKQHLERQKAQEKLQGLIDRQAIAALCSLSVSWLCSWIWLWRPPCTRLVV